MFITEAGNVSANPATVAWQVEQPNNGLQFRTQHTTLGFAASSLLTSVHRTLDVLTALGAQEYSAENVHVPLSDSGQNVLSCEHKSPR